MSGSGLYRVHLTHPAAYDASALLAFLAGRAMPGIEAVEPGAYRRTIEMGEDEGWFGVSVVPTARVLRLEIDFPDENVFPVIEARVRQIFDLDTEISGIRAHLGKDPLLRRLLERHPGVRVPGGWNPFEIAVRTVVGQQVSVAAATTVTGRIVEAYGRPARGDGECLTRHFPRAEELAAADLAPLGMPGKRAEAIRGLSRAVADGRVVFDRDMSLAEFEAMMVALPGIGPWSAAYMGMRILGEADAFPASDLGLRIALAEDGSRPSAAAVAERAEAWRPWRAYAARLLWTSLED